jgi:hypothetical protein
VRGPSSQPTQSSAFAQLYRARVRAQRVRDKIDDARSIQTDDAAPSRQTLSPTLATLVQRGARLSLRSGVVVVLPVVEEEFFPRPYGSRGHDARCPVLGRARPHRRDVGAARGLVDVEADV